MGTALIKLKIMPLGIDTNLEEIKSNAKEKIKEIKGEITKFEEVPVAFGLKSLIAYIRIDEKQDTNIIEEAIQQIDGVSSIDIIDYRKAVE